jgi:hypothetical protein
MADNNKTVNIRKSMAPIRREGVCVSMLDIHIHIRPQGLPRKKMKVHFLSLETMVRDEETH